MKRFLKKTSLAVLLSSIFLLGHYSCERQDHNLEANSKKESFERFGLKGQSYSSILDTIGKWHNDYQEGVFNSIVSG